jgi:hypothetical protein
METENEILKKARKEFLQKEEVINVDSGYRFKNGWITDEKVVVVEVTKKLDVEDLKLTGKTALPKEFMGVGIDVRTAPLLEQLEYMGINVMALMREAKPSGYKEPVGFDDPNSDMFLKRFNEKMEAIFHVSPDEGFKNLNDFIKRTKNKITATIYEWEPNHISDAIENAMNGNDKSLKMITQRTGVGERDATISATKDMTERIGNKFSHVWASTRGKNRLIPNSYHIKVACRDGEEMWLSSGNWKKSNQPKNPTRNFSDLTDYNREWHAIINHKEITQLFQRYIEYDFEQALKYPTEITTINEMYLFAPKIKKVEKTIEIDYDAELRIKDEVLDIQPLLTPDKDSEGNRLFLKEATNMIKRAKKYVYIQNQSFAMTNDNNKELDSFFEELKKKQNEIKDVRIIFRDANDFGRVSDLENQQELITRLKNYGYDTSPNKLRLQSKCHTKGIIVDGEEVILGSQNITNTGAIFNRDASLLVRNQKVAKFFERIFLFDWENLTHNDASEKIGGIRIAQLGEPTPEGFTRIKLSELLSEVDY